MQFLKDKYTLKLVFIIFNLLPFLFFRLSPAMSTLLIITKEKSLTGEEEKFVMQRLYSSYNWKKINCYKYQILCILYLTARPTNAWLKLLSMLHNLSNTRKQFLFMKRWDSI